MSTTVTDQDAVRALYEALLAAWNRRDARAMAACFAEDGSLVGFDGSAVEGRAAIEAHLAPIFAHHPTAAFVANARELRALGAGVVLVRAAVGMVPPGKTATNPAVNAVQSLVAVERDGRWCVALFQNTPAAFHGRPELAAALTEELDRTVARGVLVAW